MPRIIRQVGLRVRSTHFFSKISEIILTARSHCLLTISFGNEGRVMAVTVAQLEALLGGLGALARSVDKDEDILANGGSLLTYDLLADPDSRSFSCFQF